MVWPRTPSDRPIRRSTLRVRLATSARKFPSAKWEKASGRSSRPRVAAGEIAGSEPGDMASSLLAAAFLLLLDRAINHCLSSRLYSIGSASVFWSAAFFQFDKIKWRRLACCCCCAVLRSHSAQTFPRRGSTPLAIASAVTPGLESRQSKTC